jgi:hypothetical protein
MGMALAVPDPLSGQLRPGIGDDFAAGEAVDIALRAGFENHQIGDKLGNIDDRIDIGARRGPPIDML